MKSKSIEKEIQQTLACIKKIQKVQPSITCFEKIMKKLAKNR